MELDEITLRRISKLLKAVRYEYMYLAMDKDGTVKAFTGLPQLLDNKWVISRLEDRSVQLDVLSNYARDYKKSLYSIREERYI